MNLYKYIVSLNDIIDRPSSKILTYLYQPIVGIQAITIYKTLLEEGLIAKELKNYNFNMLRIFNLTSLSEEQYFENIKKLEAVGLLKTLINYKKEFYMFNLYSPLEPINFFDSEAFNSCLFNKIGKTDYEIIRYIFRDDNKTLYQDNGCVDISSSFNDVFSSILNNKNINEVSHLKPKPSKNCLFIEEDFKKIVDEIKKRNFVFEISLDLAKKWFNELYLLYKFRVEDFISLFSKIDKNVITKGDKNRIFALAESIKNNLFKNQNIAQFDGKEHMNRQKNLKIKEMETIKPNLYLKALLGLKTLNDDQKNLLKDLSMNYKLRDSVINCLIEFSFLKNEKLIVTNYIFKIAKSLNENSIKTADMAMEYLINAHKNSKNSKVKFSNDNGWSEAKNKKTYEVNVENDVKLDIKAWGDL
ncbi:chromosome replication initiation and membrane attachment protein [Spiroplasma litorale]|uniref:Chromosome replication initiation and membrane attachment protein n=1 Tax=Spiroplasma litorale TaxID=216942 RepID=A0A0K1W0J8_9MOLU|nr:DnaD domain protein [Spiroplasma litorale]AKX33830.1 chromosome replication initiation and membrane attachment protein [Spiroplasma litorale]